MSVFSVQERFWIEFRDRDQFRASGTVIVVVIGGRWTVDSAACGGIVFGVQCSGKIMDRIS
jgi:hypothetical protein